MLDKYVVPFKKLIETTVVWTKTSCGYLNVNISVKKVAFLDIKINTLEKPAHDDSVTPFLRNDEYKSNLCHLKEISHNEKH